MRPGTRSTGFGSPRQRRGQPRVDDDELAEAAGELVAVDRVVRALDC